MIEKIGTMVIYELVGDLKFSINKKALVGRRC